ncbi:threonine synthase [Alterisphingorhabdus coralli]|uniref:Threonine synthase n=1 Tax=Alterisphingorhabdus coralli TaxID=3071408 RepID=A0AA97F9I8_9SPHN|nr:threonine synthase [Parasphingorhabdus sp. SCSIO 66989]WOE76011.1 threonine synthase [Parasphingorhabdus sp. SCSIO 66989]
MQYISTRGAAAAQDFRGATLAGLASDGGLYLPESWPQFSKAEIAAMAGLDYASLAVRIMRPFVTGSLSDEELTELCQQAYGGFAHKAVTPLAQLDERHWLLELFHGPTLAFKDVALQFLGQSFAHFLEGHDRALTIVGATSGDTGSAAIHAVAGREGIEIFMLHPHGRISDVQRRQMTTVLSPNVHNIAIEGNFDDAQAMVKRMFGDSALTDTLDLSAVNSINWARLMAQIVYYFAAALQLGAPHRPVAFSVPTGNFGDVFAGYVASRMGLPVERLIVATNINDILHRALSSGDYSRAELSPTATPSMDIQVSSNFERLLFDLGGRDGAAMAETMRSFDASGALQIDETLRAAIGERFVSERVDGDAMSRAIRWAYEEARQVIDPHTAIGLAAAHRYDGDPAVPVVTLATAHPAKFDDAVERACGIRPALPTRVGDLFDRQEQSTVLPNDYEAVRQFVIENAMAKANA